MKQCLLMLLALLTCSIFAQEVEQAGKIESVILYRGQALVTRHIDLDIESGTHQLVVTNLPIAIQSDSLFANSGDGVSIRGVRFRKRIVGESPMEEAKTLQKEIEALEKNIRKNQNSQNLLTAQQQHLDGLRQFVIPTAKMEISKGVLNPQSLTELMSYVFNETKRINEELFNLNEDMIELKEKLGLVRNQFSQIAGGSSKNVLEAVIFFEKSAAGKAFVKLNYIVSSSTWSPFYNIRAEKIGDKVNLEYGALVQQTSGEDWTNVVLTLSTASIEMSAEAPTLAPMLVTLEREKNSVHQDLVVEQYRNLQNQQREAFNSRGRSNRQMQMMTDWNINKYGNDIQGLEFSSGGKIQDKISTQRSGLTVNYQISGKVSITSRSDRQMVEISRLNLATDFSNITNPLLSEYIYREAQVVNSDEIALLEGKANVYLAGQFVGTSTVPMTAKGQKFTIGFGIDSQLRSWRELVSKTESIQGGNKILLIKYRLVLDNYKSSNENVVVYDRIPQNNQSLRVTIDSSSQISEDPEYLRNLKPEGILRWETKVPAKSAAKTSHIIEYSCKLEFEKGMTISTNVSQGEEKKYRTKYMK